MRKKHIRLARLINQFHFVDADHTDSSVESFIHSWREMKGNVDKLVEVGNVLNFCFQNRHFIRKYPEVTKLLQGDDAQAAFITFHALGGVYPLREPGRSRVSIGEHLESQITGRSIDFSQVADQAFSSPGRPRVWPRDSEFRPISEGTVDSMPYRSEGLSYLTPESLAGLGDALKNPENRSAAKSLLPAEDSTKERETRLSNEIRHTFRHQREADEAVKSLKDFDKPEE